MTTNTNTNTYSLNNYSIITSLNERTIYFKITDTVSFYQYEGNVDVKELRLNFDLHNTYTIINNCFKNLDGDYSVNISVNSNMLKLQFNALVGGFLKMDFDIMLREKVMSNDGQLTINFNRLEQKLVAGLQRLEQRCQELEEIIEEKNSQLLDLTDKLSNAHICFTYSGHPNPIHFVALNVKELTSPAIQFSNDNNSFKYEMFEKLYQLEKLTTTYFRATNFAIVKFKSNSLKELYMHVNNEGTLTSLEGINNIPNLEKLTIISAPSLTNIPTVLKSYKHKINYIKIQSCAQVNVVELQTYCQTNNIKLEIS